MRLNRYLAQHTLLSRRAADQAILGNRVRINENVARLGDQVNIDDIVTLDEKIIQNSSPNITLLFHKPKGYVCSRNGQGSPTIYKLLPDKYMHLNSIGRLDKESSGLLLLTSDGELANKLSHPRYQKQKMYQIKLQKNLSASDKIELEQGVMLEDGLSKLKLDGQGKEWVVTMSEGRNRQIRRSFEKVNYRIVKLHRIQFGSHKLDSLKEGSYKLTQ